MLGRQARLRSRGALRLARRVMDAQALPPRVLVLVGLPASGKTTLARALQGAGWAWVNQARAGLVRGPRAQAQGADARQARPQDSLGSRGACEEACAEALAAQRRCVVVDRCNFDAAQRATWLLLARRHRAYPLAFHLDVPAGECVRRALARPAHPTLGAQNAASVIHGCAGTLPVITSIVLINVRLRCTW